MTDREHIHDPRLTTADLAARDARTTDELRNVDGHNGQPSPDEPIAPLFHHDEVEQLKARWSEIKAAFVDEPRRSVEEADGLVAATIKRLAESFADTRSALESEWARGADVSTEDLRLALRRYRSFFDRLVAV